MIGLMSARPGDTIFYRFVVYNAPADAGEHRCAMKVKVVQGKKAVYESDWQPLATQAIRHDSKGIEVGGQLKLILPQDSYTLRVTVRDARTKKTAELTFDLEIEE
jgi:hypothetical protein